MKSNKSGWKGESRRHSLARKGIRTVNMNAMGSSRFLKNDNSKRVYTGEVAKQILMDMLDQDDAYWKKNYLGNSGYFKEGEMWTAWDNSYGELSVENFWMKDNARSWATELDTTADEMHKKDIKDVFNEIMGKSDEFEVSLWNEAPISHEVRKEIFNFLKSNDVQHLGEQEFNQIAYILKTHRNAEKDLNYNLSQNEQTIVTEHIIDTMVDRFKDNINFQRSNKWKTINQIGSLGFGEITFKVPTTVNDDELLKQLRKIDPEAGTDGYYEDPNNYYTAIVRIPDKDIKKYAELRAKALSIAKKVNANMNYEELRGKETYFEV